MPNPPPAKVFTISDSLKDGYSFSKDRWEGDCENSARMVAFILMSKGGHRKASVYTDNDWDWRGGKRTDYTIYKVWVLHPTNDDLYAWWTPTDKTWSQPFDNERATWFEFQAAK